MSKLAAKKRHRRAPEDLVAALQAKIEAIKARAERKRARANPALRHTIAAVRSMDKAMTTTEDNVLKKALEGARGELVAYLSLQGMVPTGGTNGTVRQRRSSEDVERMGDSLLSYLSKNPGQRGEDIAAGLGMDSKTIRLPMKRLIAEGKVKTKGDRRAMKYWAT